MKPTSSNLNVGLSHFWQIYRAGLWEPATKEFFQSVLKPRDLFVDIGAWVGPTALWALELGATVVAIEPDAIALQHLYKIPNLEVWPVAVAPKTGVVKLAPNPKEGGEWGDSMTRVSDDGVIVPAVSLPEILNGRIPKLVKMDVEGYEMELCPSLIPWLSEIGCDAVQISCHGAFPDRELFEGFRVVSYPSDLWGDIQCRM